MMTADDVIHIYPRFLMKFLQHPLDAVRPFETLARFGVEPRQDVTAGLYEPLGFRPRKNSTLTAALVKAPLPGRRRRQLEKPRIRY
jgi:hypothetical protein